MTEPLQGPIDLLPAPFDGYEVALCAEVTDARGFSDVEQVISPTHLLDLLAEGSPLTLMFTVYGHFPAGGVHAFADSIVTDENPWEEARQYALRLAETIDAGRTKHGVADYTFPEPTYTLDDLPGLIATDHAATRAAYLSERQGETWDAEENGE